MEVSKLVKKCKDEYKNIEITSLAFDSRQVTDGSLFFCLSGKETDGHIFVSDAIKNGARAIVAEHITDGDIPHIIVDDTREALCEASSNFFGMPHKELKLYGITGTNGKTTTSYILDSIFRASGKKTGIIGTNAIVIDGKKYNANMTTPDPIEFHSTLRKMADCGVEVVIMEVSAHALELKKMHGIQFECAGFTNLSRDHLDFFGDMKSYFTAKKRLFTSELAKHAVINVDDKSGVELLNSIKIPHTTYGCYNPSDVFAINLYMSTNGLRYVLNSFDDIEEIKFALPGKFNMYNTLLAGAMARSSGISLEHIKAGIADVKRVDGRFNIIKAKNCTIIVDFAHTDDGIKNVLETIKEFSKKKVICLFGCGGDRDKTKRPIMGDVVTRTADYTFITSDNSRFENPRDIIYDIEKGIASQIRDKYSVIVDRKVAIESAIDFAQDGDILLVSGKGNENYLDVMGEKTEYNDEEYIKQVLANRGE